MRVYSRKTFLFEDGDEKVIVRNEGIKDIPDWVENTPFFKLAESSGDIEIINSVEKQKVAENGKKNKKQESPTTNEE